MILFQYNLQSSGKAMNDNEIKKEIRHLLRLSAPRELYTIPQASFRMNCSRNEFENLYLRTGKIKIIIYKGKKMVPHIEIEKYVESLKRFTSPEAIG